ncbi:MAG: homoserine dehydrogenase [Taibaiella sp.]|nr:homoserine dehydrogenase [Taibaiella sp.]
MSIQNTKGNLTIGLFGFGIVGESLFNVLNEKPTFGARVKRICIKDAEKPRSAPSSLFTTDPDELLNDKEIDVIVELISDSEAAYRFVSTALHRGKPVVSASKKMIAENLDALIALQKQTGTSFLYEAGCCASIPVLRNLEEYYDNDLLQRLSGVVNGSTNYILTRQAKDGYKFEQALSDAQEAGFAEADPSLDLEGVDAANKLVLLLVHAYGIVAHPAQLLYSGITGIHDADIKLAREKGYEVKLIAHALKTGGGDVAAFVLPQFVERQSRLAGVAYEYNGLEIESSLADVQFLCGKGAGGYPTASAVLSDLSALRYNYRYEYKKLTNAPSRLCDDYYLHVCVGARSLLHIPQEHFEQVEEWVSSERRCYLSGTIHVNKLLGTDWWRKPGVSLILYPDPISHEVVTSDLHEYAGI